MGRKRINTYKKKKNLGIRVLILFIAAAMITGVIFLIPLRTYAIDEGEGSLTVNAFETGELNAELEKSAGGIDNNNIFNITVSGGTLDADDYKAVLSAPNIETLELAGCETEGGVIPDYALSGRNRLSYVSLPGNTVEIGKGAFSNNKMLVKAIMPETVKTIGDYAFEGCETLEDINIPGGVSFIGEGAFRDCLSLEDFTLPAGITEILPHTFSKCGFFEIHLGSGIKNIGDGAFSDCHNLKDIYFYGANPPEASVQKAFMNVSASIHVKGEYAENYKSLEGNNIYVTDDLDSNTVHMPEENSYTVPEIYDNSNEQAQPDETADTADVTGIQAETAELNSDVAGIQDMKEYIDAYMQEIEPEHNTVVTTVIIFAVVCIIVFITSLLITVRVMKKKTDKQD